MLGALLQKIRPFARSVKYGRLLRRAQADAKDQSPSPLSPAVGFILGSGRSGTTILGKLLSTHRGVHYIREPYYIWRAIVPASDMIRFFGDAGVEPHCVMGSEFVTSEIVDRFNACMHAELRRSGSETKRLIEKTPINAMRIPMLNSLSPSSPILHLVRNGVDVVRSIERLSGANTYRLGGKGKWNQWWGRDNCKWKALASDARAHGWFADEIDLLQNNVDMGALEWVISLDEINRHRGGLGDRLLEVGYGDLTKDPKSQLNRICEHFEIDPEPEWTTQSSEQLDSERKNTGDPIVLPSQLCAAFNTLQEQYGFDGVAVEA